MIILHHLTVHRPIPLFDSLGLPHIPAIYVAILEVEFARVFAEVRIVIAQQVCGFEIYPALLSLLLLPLMQLHLGHQLTVLRQNVAQGVVIVKGVIFVIVFCCTHETR